MQKKVKIIHILCHPPHPIINNIREPEDYFEKTRSGEFIKIPEKPYWVGFFTIDHHVVAAEKLKKKTDEFDVECWRPYGSSIKDVYSREINGITHRIFPSFSVNIPQIGAGTFSPQLLEFLLNYIKTNKVILNVSTGHAWFHIWLFLKLRKVKFKLPIVALQISGGFKKHNFKQLHPIKKLFKWFYLIEHNIDLRSLIYTDNYLVGSMVELNYLRKIKSINSSFFSPGVDLKFFIKTDDKIKLRKELGLPLDKKIMIVTGNFRRTDYGYHHLIDCYSKIRAEYDDLQLVIIGGYKNEDLYEVALKSGILMIERAPKEILLKYYQASDFYGQPSLSFGFINYGGFGYAMMEALACGLPILSQNIIHFPGTIEERNKIGMDMPTKEDLVSNMIYLKDNFQNYSECRAIAQKYFDIEKTKLVLLDLYKKLSKQYFTEEIK